MRPEQFPLEFNPLAEHFSDLAIRRYSCRSFDGSFLDVEQRTRLLAAINALNRVTPPGLRLALLDAAALRRENLFSTGTYGMIRRPVAYLAGVSAPKEINDWIEFGRAMQSLIMLATWLGIDSCWIGGVFDRRTFSRVLDLAAEEKVPAVAALGIAARRRTLRDRLVRRGSGGDHRRPFGELFFDGEWGRPLEPSASPRVAPLLDNLRRAPSASNRQPWRAVVHDHEIDLYLLRTPGYQRLTPRVDLQAVDMGIAAAHLEWSAREKKLDLCWSEVSPAPVPGAEPIRKAILNTEA